MDPVYCAPEQYILPVTMPEAPPSPLMPLLAPLLFLAHAPDKFDLYSAGLVLLQLAVPTLRADKSLVRCCHVQGPHSFFPSFQTNVDFSLNRLGSSRVALRCKQSSL